MTDPDRDAELAAAHDAIDALREKLDLTLVSEEAAKRDRHVANNRSQKLLAIAEAAAATLGRHGHGDDAARFLQQIAAAMGDA